MLDSKIAKDISKIRGHGAIKEKDLTRYLEATIGTPDWGAKHSGATTLALLGLHWYQERATEGYLDEIGQMETLHKEI